MEMQESGRPRSWQIAQTGRYAAAIEAFVEEVPGRTFVEIERFLESFMPVKGSTAICLPDDTNIILWAGMSDAFIDIMHECQQGRRLEMRPTHILTYFVDGKVLKLPLAKRLPKAGYKKEHWAPVAFYPKPSSE